MTESDARRTSLGHRIVLVVVFSLMTVLITVNLAMSNFLGLETCALVHPLFFKVDVSFEDTKNGVVYYSTVSSLQSNEEADFDTVLRLYDENNDLIATNDDRAFGDIRSALRNVRSDANRRLIVEAAAFNDNQSGNVRIVARAATTPDHDIIPVGSTRAGTILSGQRERFLLSSETDQWVTIEVSAENNRFDPYLRLYGVQLIAENDNSARGLSSEVTFLLRANEPMIAEVAAANDRESGNFEIRSVGIAAPTPLALDTPTNGTLEPFMRDRYLLAATEDQALVFSVEGDPGTHLLRFYALSGALLREVEVRGRATVEYAVSAENPVIVEVGTVNDVFAGDYTLNAAPIAPTRLVTAPLRIAEEESVFFTAQVEAGQPFTVLTQPNLNSSDRIDTVLILTNETTGEVLSNDDFEVLYAGVSRYVSDVDATLRIEFYELNGNAANFDIQFETITYNDAWITPPDAAGPLRERIISRDQAIFESGYLGADSTVSLTLEYDPTALSAESGSRPDIVTVDVLVSSEFDSTLSAYDRNGTQISFSDDYSGLDAGMVDLSLGANEPIRFELAGFSAVDAGNFSIRVENFPVDASAMRFESSASNTLPFVVEPPTQSLAIGEDDAALTGFIRSGHRVRYFIDLEAGQPVDLFLEQNPSAIDSRLLGVVPELNPACLQFYGFSNVSEESYKLNQNGFTRFVQSQKNLCPIQDPDATVDELLDSCSVRSSVSLTIFGRLMLLRVAPLLAVVLPLILIAIVSGSSRSELVAGAFFAAAFVLTISVFYLQMGDVAATGDFKEIAYALFGGVSTGAALAVISSVIERFSQDREN